MKTEESASHAVAGKAESGIRWFLVRYRIHLSLIVFTGLIAEDVLIGHRPHDVFNVFDWHSVTGLSLIVFGLTLRSWAAGTLHKWNQLTTTGPYREIRNPLYVGSFLVMIGFCLVIDDPENIWFVLGPMSGLYLLKVRSEERKLAGKFGDMWTSYANCTPRILPRRWLTFSAGEWQLDQWLKNREYQAVLGTLVGLVAIQLWHVGVFRV